MQQELPDVLVIGSGAAGAAVTKRLTDLGAKVVCLEQGGWIHSSDYPSTKPNWEIQLKTVRDGEKHYRYRRFQSLPVKPVRQQPLAGTRYGLYSSF